MKRKSLQQRLAERKAKEENRRREIEDAVIEALQLDAPTAKEILEFVSAKCGHYHERSIIRMAFRIMHVEINEENMTDYDMILL